MVFKDFFHRTRILNLPSRPDRRREMTAELTRAGFFPSAHVHFADAQKFSDNGGFSTIGARGCFLSHLSILQQARDESWPNVLIMEDDLAFTSHFQTSESDLTAQLQSTPWSLAYFAYKFPFNDPSAPTVTVAEAEEWQHRCAEIATLKAFPPHLEFLQAAFYAVNGPTIRLLASYLEAILGRPAGHPDGGPMNVDGAYNLFRRSHPEHVCLLSTPVLAEERPSRSDILPSRLDRIPLFRPVLSLARSAKRRISSLA